MTRRYRFGVVLSVAIGNRTRYNIFRKYAERDPEVEFVWAPVKHYFAPEDHDPFKWLSGRLKDRAIVFYEAWPVIRHLPTFDAVLLHMYEIELLTAVRSYFRHRPLRVVSTDDAPVVEPENYPIYPHEIGKPAWKRAVRLRIDLWRARRADLAVPFSKWAADILVRLCGIPAERVKPLHVGLDLEQWTLAPPRRPLDAAGSTTPARVKLLFVGAEFERKGGALLLDAYSRCFSESAELHLVTKTPLERLPAHVTVYNDLTAADGRLKQLYQTADILVHPTTCDLSAWVVLEAMACGCPPVTTRMAGISELVEDGVSGLLVPTGDAAALAAAIQRLIADPGLRRAMGERSRQRIERDFDASVNVPKIIQLMKSAVDRTRPKTPAGAA